MHKSPMGILAIIMLLGINVSSHPISQEMVDMIREKATTWIPMEVSQNPLAKYTESQLNSLFGVKLYSSQTTG